ncbi:MAG TPA: (4Fe-4S)-binding protein [Streptosporangiaceae bacterium]|jgi:uncharacterized Fe-S cluster protein YjdI
MAAEHPTGKAYPGDRVTVTYDTARCVHFGECVRGLGAVFDTARRPWITPDAAPPEEVAEVVRRCPSGALHYTGPADEAPDRPTSVRTVTDGPLLLRGDLTIATPAGELRDTRAALCACGRTANTPFCDTSCDGLA